MIETTIRVRFADQTGKWLGARAREFEVGASLWTRLWKAQESGLVSWVYLGLWVLPENRWDGLEQLWCPNLETLRQALLAPQTQSALLELGTSLLHLQRQFGRTLRAASGTEPPREAECWERIAQGVKAALPTALPTPADGAGETPFATGVAAAVRDALADSVWLGRVQMMRVLEELPSALQEETELQGCLEQLQQRGLLEYECGPRLRLRLVGARRVTTLQLA